MFVKQLLPAFVAIGSVAAQAGTCTVSGGTTTINSQAEATKLASCRTVKGSVVLGSQTGSQISLDGPREISGDLSIDGNGDLESLSSSSLETIGGTFLMKNATKISSVQFPKLASAKVLDWQSLSALDTLRFAPLNKADEVTISDTFLQSLDGIDLTSVKKLFINNNRRLQKFSTELKNVGEELNINANGIGLGCEVDMPNLVWAAEMAIANVTKFSVPSLEVVNGSARFDSNFFESFSAPNLTHTETGDISFVGNSGLKNITLPKLTEIAGGLTVANNTKLDKFTFFPELEKIGGAVILRGNFTEVEFPKLESVKGAFFVTSTADIKTVCEKLGESAPTSQGGDGKIEGTFECVPENEKANDETDDTTDGGNGSSGGNGDDEDKPNGASGLVFNAALFGLVAVAGFASAL
jgi:hypothetical protein